MSNEKRYPIQGGLTVSWEAAERAYKHYAKRFGTYQSLERLAERGGFGLTEFALLYHDIPPCATVPTQRLDQLITSAIVAGDVRYNRPTPTRAKAETLCSTCADQGSCDVKRVDDEHLGPGCDQWRAKE